VLLGAVGRAGRPVERSLVLVRDSPRPEGATALPTGASGYDPTMADEDPQDPEPAVERAREALDERDESRVQPDAQEQTLRRVREALRAHDQRSR